MCWVPIRLYCLYLPTQDIQFYPPGYLHRIEEAYHKLLQLVVGIIFLGATVIATVTNVLRRIRACYYNAITHTKYNINFELIIREFMIFVLKCECKKNYFNSSTRKCAFTSIARSHTTFDSKYTYPEEYKWTIKNFYTGPLSYSILFTINEKKRSMTEYRSKSQYKTVYSFYLRRITIILLFRFNTYTISVCNFSSHASKYKYIRVDNSHMLN